MSQILIAASVVVCLALQAGPAAAQTAPNRTETENRIASSEKAIIDAIFKNDAKTFHSYVVPDSYAVGGEGVLKVSAFDQMMNEMKTNCKVAKWAVSDPTFYWFNDSTVVYTYKLTVDGTCQNQPMGATWGSSVWVNKGGKWLGAFHQDTEVSPPAAKK